MPGVDKRASPRRKTYARENERERARRRALAYLRSKQKEPAARSRSRPASPARFLTWSNAAISTRVRQPGPCSKGDNRTHSVLAHKQATNRTPRDPVDTGGAMGSAGDLYSTLPARQPPSSLPAALHPGPRLAVPSSAPRFNGRFIISRRANAALAPPPEKNGSPIPRTKRLTLAKWVICPSSRAPRQKVERCVKRGRRISSTKTASEREMVR